MKEEDIHQITKRILMNSNLNLTKSDFNKIVLEKVKKANQRKFIIRNLYTSFLIFCTLELLMFSLFKLIGFGVFEKIKELTNFHMINSTNFIFVYFLIIMFVAISMNLVSNLTRKTEYS